MVPAALVDRHQQRLPDPIIGIAAALFVVVTLGAAVIGHPMNLGPALVGAAVFAGPLLVLHLVSPVSMGFGDVKAAAVLGLAVGAVNWQLALAALALATGIAAVAGIATHADTVALGPALVVAAALSLAAATTFAPTNDTASTQAAQILTPTASRSTPR